MRAIGIIPARYSSSRFPGKPLVIIKGKSMIQRVYEQAFKASALDDVYVATDDKLIYDHVKGFGGKVIMTSVKHQTGTDRIAEAVRKIKKRFDVVVNIQGDEPFIHPSQINAVVALFKKKGTQLATLAKQLTDIPAIVNPSIIKVVLDKEGNGLYFSRAPLPYNRNLSFPEIKYYKHIGIYGYRAAVLAQITKLKQTPLEKAESLEQLRWLENGYKIRVGITQKETWSVDVPSDLQRFDSPEFK
jgi:3-deoxy-manno-octulosonate cytidylyltransferase (CMP-KDO synthetase)